MENKKSWS